MRSHGMIKIFGKKGMFFPLVLFAAIIVVGFLYAFHQYRVSQITQVDEIASFYAASCVAEAGISCAVAELRSNSVSWKTHNVKLAGGQAVWDTPLAHTNMIQPAGVLASFTGANGTVTGSFGLLGEFKVRCGLAPVPDNPDTKAVNEAQMYYKIDSIGKYNDIYVKVSCVVEARNLSEFLVYDGDFLDMTLGVANSIVPDATNNYKIGTLYGKRFVFLGSVNGGPKLEFKDVSDIMTGTTGEIYTFDPKVSVNNTQLDRTRNSSKALIAPQQGGDVRDVSQLKRANTWNANFDTVNGVLKDSKHGGRDMPVITSANFVKKYKGLAKNGGIYIAAPGNELGVSNADPNNIFAFDNPYKVRDGQPVDLANMRYVDFGSSINEQAKNDVNNPAYNLQFFPGMERESNIKDVNVQNKLKSNTFNGVIYSEVPLRIRGNPPRDMVIASNKDIYICGDLNQATDVMQNYVDDSFFDYQPNPMTGVKYLDEDSNFRTANSTLNKGLYRHRVTVFSNAKIWYDYTRPDMVFENELKPLIEWELCTKLAGFGQAATDKQYVYDKIMKFKLTGGKVDVSNLNDYVLTGRAAPAAGNPDSPLKKAETQNVWGDPAQKASHTAFCTDPKNAPVVTYLDSLFNGGNPAMTGQKFIEDTVFVVRDTANPPGPPKNKTFLQLINDPANAGKLDVVSRAALVNAIFAKISEIKPNILWANHTNTNYMTMACVSTGNQPSNDASLAGRLFHEVGVDLNTKKDYCQFKTPPKKDYETDRLFFPEMTMNARVISSDFRRPDSLWHIGNTPDAIYNELGNRYVPAAGYKAYLPQVTAILRLLGSEIFLRENNVLPPMTGTVYFPNLRRKMYDSALNAFEDPQGLTNYGLATWAMDKAARSDFDTF